LPYATTRPHTKYSRDQRPPAVLYISVAVICKYILWWPAGLPLPKHGAHCIAALVLTIESRCDARPCTPITEMPRRTSQAFASNLPVITWSVQGVHRSCSRHTARPSHPRASDVAAACTVSRLVRVPVRLGPTLIECTPENWLRSSMAHTVHTRLAYYC
jgi:hypothetical protein